MVALLAVASMWAAPVSGQDAAGGAATSAGADTLSVQRLQRAGSAAGWASLRAAIVRGMAEVMGPLPGDERRAPLDPQLVEEVDAGTYLRRLVTYQSEPGSRTPAYLCVPKALLAGGGGDEAGAGSGRAKAPAVLCLHPTDNTVGHKVVVGLGGRAGRQYAAELAERGFVTLAPAYPHLANYWPDLEKLGYASGTMKAVWDNTRALDLLETLPYVDASRGFGVIGHSLGGHNAIFTAALEPRLTVVATSCSFDAFPHYYGGDERNWQPGKGWCQVRYMPRLAGYRGRLDEVPFDFPGLLAALAPRRVHISAPLRDGNFRWKSAAACAAAARPVYQLLGAEGKLTVEHPETGHDFAPAQREAAYRIIGEVLRRP